MAIAETAARRLLHGGSRVGAAVARGVAAGTLGFGLDGLWQLIGGFFANIFAGAAHLLALPFEAIWHLLFAAVTAVAGAISSGLGGLWQLVVGFFHNLFASLAGAAHRILVLPVEVLWQWLAGAAGAIGSGLGGLWQLVAGFFPNLFAALAGVAHRVLVLPFEALWQWLVAAVTGAANAVSSGVHGLWQIVAGFFPNLFAALAGAAHRLLVLPLEALWQWLAGAAGAISSGIGGLWQLVAGFFPHLLAALTGGARELAPKLEAFWRWLQSAAAAALPYVLAAAAVLLVVALVFYFILPSCIQCCPMVTMNAPGAAGMLISRTAFEAAPRLYFLILRAGGAVVATAVFCAWPVASAVAAPVAFLFCVSVRA